MSNINIIISKENFQNVLYRNAEVIKVYEDDIYDIKFSTGRIKTYVENTSNQIFNSGDYVSVLLSREKGVEICKILGKGRKINPYMEIPIVKVWENGNKRDSFNHWVYWW